MAAVSAVSAATPAALPARDPEDGADPNAAIRAVAHPSAATSTETRAALPSRTLWPTVACVGAAQAAAMAAFAWGIARGTDDACSSNAELACRCPVATLAWTRLEFVCLSLGYRLSYARVASELLGRRGLRAALALVAGGALAEYAIGLVLLDAADADAALVWSLGKPLEALCLWLFAAAVAPTPALRRRVRPLIEMIMFSFVSTSLLTSAVAQVVNNAPALADEALVAVPALTSLVEGLYCALLARRAAGWEPLHLSVVARAQVSALEGMRVGMLLVSADRSAQTFLLSLALSVPLEVASRNDLYFTGLRKLALGWSDARVRARFSTAKEAFLSGHFDAEYAPVAALVCAAALGTLSSRSATGCDGELVALFRPGWAFVAAVLVGDLLTDALALVARRALARRRPLLARELRVVVPPDRGYAGAIVLSTLYNAVVGMSGAAFLVTASSS